MLFVDEIHRFNKAQQDALLPHVEDGTVTLIGATTENPSFEVNAALLSRCRVVRLEALAEDELRALVDRALADAERGLGKLPLDVADEVRDLIAREAGGDARRALSTLEVAAEVARAGSDGRRHVDRTARRGGAAAARRCSTTRPARSTTTSSPPSSSRCAAPIPTPRSTG